MNVLNTSSFDDNQYAAMQDSDFLRKSDVAGAAAAAGVAFDEKMYSKAMKELCTSKGGMWTIKKRAE